ncbi:hypothetical protein [Kerstersia gyiorum]|uniref:Uncharacterized protein n=1 Tax=Kerstersia gyiorum TaxID=206506 RepID=A0A171KSE3_9BURK|nr:hypothetical protein [Kerstersia gyiorum]KKO71810.1 hypothetical protein AAV32_09545 [Kerstersia gyiorum]
MPSSIEVNMEHHHVNWKLAYAEAEKQVPLRQNVADIFNCSICLFGLIVVMPWVGRLIIESGILP